MPLQAPDLTIAFDPASGWIVRQVSQRLSEWIGLGDLEVAGLWLNDIFADVMPGLDYLADEVRLNRNSLRGIAVHFQGREGRSLIADVAPGDADKKGLLQVYFYFRRPAAI